MWRFNTWEDVLSSIDNLLMETEIQDNNSDLGFHEAALVLNRIEMAVSVLRAIVDMELDLEDLFLGMETQQENFDGMEFY